MIAEAPARQGRTIVTVTSANAVMVSPEKTPYCLSKSALSMMVELFGVRLAEHGIAPSRSAPASSAPTCPRRSATGSRR